MIFPFPLYLYNIDAFQNATKIFWSPLLDFLHDKEKNEALILGLDLMWLEKYCGLLNIWQ